MQVSLYRRFKEIVFSQIKRLTEIANFLDAITKMLFSAFKIIAILIITFFSLYFSYTIAVWLLEVDEGINIEPFEVDKGVSLNGNVMAELLLLDLYNIDKVISQLPIRLYDHENSQAILSPPDDDISSNSSKSKSSHYTLTSLESDPLQSISGIGTIGLEKNSISIGNILLSIKQLKSSSVTKKITGRVQNYGSTISMMAIMEDPQDSRNKYKVWESERSWKEDNASIEELIPAMIEDLAFQIYYDEMVKKIKKDEQAINYPKSSQGFKFLIQGWEASLIYVATRDITALDKARDLALSAKRSEYCCLGSLDLLYELAGAYSEMNQYEDTINIFQDITNDSDDLSRIIPDMDMDEGDRYRNLVLAAYSSKGYVFFMRDNYNKSEQANIESLNFSESVISSWNDKSNNLMKQGKYTEANNADDKSREVALQTSDALINKGYSLYANEKYEGAIDAFGKAIELDRENIDAWYGRGKAFKDLGMYDEALEDYTESIAINPCYEEAYYGKFRALTEDSRYDEAIQVYGEYYNNCNEAIQKNEYFSDIYNVLGWELYKKGNYEIALKYANKAIEIDEENDNALDTKGASLIGLKRYAEAIKPLDSAIKIYPNSIRWFHKAEAFNGSGNYTEALEAYNRSIELEPNVPDGWYGKSRVLERLGRITDATASEEKGKNLEMEGDDHYEGWDSYGYDEYPHIILIEDGKAI